MLRFGDDGRFLSNSDIRLAIEASCKRIDVLGLDACCMGMLEIAYELRRCAPFTLLSEGVTGVWPYSGLTMAIAETPNLSPEDLTRLTVQLAEQLNEAADNDLGRGAVGPISAWSNADIEPIAGAIGAYGERLAAILDGDGLAVRTAVQKAFRAQDPDAPDLWSLVAKLRSVDRDVSRLGSDVIDRLNHALLGESPKNNGLGGLSIFCPTDKLDVDAVYRGLQFAENPWVAFLRAYQRMLLRWQRG
jgi:hypothetical protein